MKILFLLLISVIVGYAQSVAIFPEPLEIKQQKGTFNLTVPLAIHLNHPADSFAFQFLNEYLRTYYGQEINNSPRSKNSLSLVFDSTCKMGKEGYVLEITRKSTILTSNSHAGIFHGIQTLIQLLPVSEPGKRKISIPVVSITDSARFAYRGLHLDVARHFFSIDFIKKYLNYMALHKMNYFHWHLTDDQGWRIEIKKFPLLTTKAGCRAGTIIGHAPGNGNDSTTYCGFYTQEEIKEIVAYAASRHITVIPEIEMPGHSSAALAAYPSLGCPGTGPYKVEESWGVFEDVYCAGNDSVFSFLEGVLEEVMMLFPSPYLHIGGDECPKHNWRKCDRCNARITSEGLKDAQELQSYFIKRIEKYVNSKGRTIIGWDEILDGGIAPHAWVMSWRGKKGGINAARQKHFAIMSPADFLYLDHAQHRTEDSLTIGGFNPVDVVHKYEPVPKELSAGEQEYIIGAQGNLWTEYITNPAKAEYMLFPRITALSEVLWCHPTRKTWEKFKAKMPQQLKRYELWHVNYSK